MRQTAGGGQLDLVQPGRLTDRPQPLPGTLSVLPPYRHDLAFVGTGLGHGQILGADVAAAVEPHRGELAGGDPAADDGAREPGALARPL